VALQQTGSSSSGSRSSSFAQRNKVRESLRESLDNKRSDGPKVSLPPKGLASGFTPRDRQSSSSSNRGFTPSSGGGDLDEIRPASASKKTSSAAAPSSSSSPAVTFGKKPKIEFKKFDRFERPDIRKNLLNKFLKNRPAGGDSNDTSAATPPTPNSGSSANAGAEEEEEEEEEGEGGEEEGLGEFPDDHESSPSALVPSIINDEDILQHLGEAIFCAL
jgi:hypothetical protein